MKISDHRITIKTLRESDKGWSKPSHQTHIGCCADYIDNWKEDLVLDGYAVIKDFGVKRMTAYSKPIKRKSGQLDAPSFKATPLKNKKPGKYDSLLKVAREASQTIRDEWNTLNILMIICFNEKKEIVVLLLEFEDDVLAKIKNNTQLINDKYEIPAQVLKKEHKSFQYIKDFAQFYANYISVNLSAADKTKLQAEGIFDYKNINDARKKLNRYISIRQGQPEFRRELLKNYKQKCCMTECDVRETLEACHIYPYMGPKTNHIQNGIILRSDLHTLYDRGLIGIDTNYKIKLTNFLKKSSFYSYLDKRPITLPNLEKNRPSLEAIDLKLKELYE